jgi:hypothetical protein
MVQVISFASSGTERAAQYQFSQDKFARLRADAAYSGASSLLFLFAASAHLLSEYRPFSRKKRGCSHDHVEVAIVFDGTADGSFRFIATPQQPCFAGF